MSDLYVIAEAGVNHNGSVDLAIEMVELAARAGADAVKFQTFTADSLVSADAPMAEYQKASVPGHRTQWELLKGLELTHEEFGRVRDRCRELEIDFLSTGFDLDELRFLIEDLGTPRVKIASGDLTFAPMLVDAGRSGLPVILSTGMADLEEIGRALEFIAFGVAQSEGALPVDAVPTGAELAALRDGLGDRLRGRVTVLHCTTQYPAPPESLNLRAMTSIRERYGVPVGYSDHSLGDLASIVAVAHGAAVIEKHFTLDKGFEGPDHAASLDPAELVEFVARLRAVEVVSGSAEKRCQPVEEANRALVRRSIVAAVPIAAGSVITADAVAARRPADGRSAFDFWEIVGTTADRDYAVGEHVG